MARLGTRRRPVVARVQTEDRLGEIAAICEQHGWQFTIGIEEDKPEDISDVLKLLKKQRPSPPSGFTPRRSRNDYCPCGSEKKYKNCCWDKDHPEGAASK